MMEIFAAFGIFLTAQLSGSDTFERQPRDIVSLDAAILKKHMETLYGEFGKPETSTWEVALGGAVEKWTWDGKTWGCPESQVGDCSNWIPKSFEWWQSKSQWLTPWVSFRRLGFLLDDEALPKRASRTLPSFLSSDQEGGLSFENLNFEAATADSEVSDMEDDEPIRLGGKRLALEKWQWTDQSGRSNNIYISLRNQWVERIDYDGGTEYIEWMQKNRWVKPTIQRVIVHKNGMQASLRRLEPEPKKKK